jgi:hypothetical protein
VATAWRRAERPIAPELTLETLFDNHVNEVTPRKSESSQHHDRRATALFLELWGRSRKVA